MATNGDQAHPVLCSVNDFVAQKFDYLIIGGGTAGLVLANRLSEDSNVQVGVLEAGPAKLNDPMILTPGLATQNMFNPACNWMMKSIPQVHGGNRAHDVPRGKVLGGSSAINYVMYARGQTRDYDDWEALGNKGWGWSGIKPYMLKHEHFEGKDSKFSHEAEAHGQTGGIHTSFPNSRCDEIEDAWFEATRTVLKDHHPSPKDAWAGDHTGVYTSLCTIDQTSAKGTRSYATSGYLVPILDRKNLKVLTEATVNRIILEKNSESVKATGVEFTHAEGTHTVNTTRDIIVSAGAISTPQVLELSGIGDPEVLSKVGIETIVENRHVGANFQDHLLTGVTYNLDPSVQTLDKLHDPETQKKAIEQYMTEQTGPLGNGQTSMGFISYKSIATDSELESTTALAKEPNDIDRAQAEIEIDRLHSAGSGTLHIYGVPATFDLSNGHECAKYWAPPPPGASRITFGASLQYPFSRGSVHISSRDPNEQPVIDQGYLSHPADVAVLCAGVKFAEKCFQEPSLKSRVTQRQLPGPDVDLNDSKQLEDYVRNHSNTEFHPIATASMGKVVDDRLRVKGVSGLRVCDASVFPVNISGNLVATVYAVAEKGADIIKEDWR